MKLERTKQALPELLCTADTKWVLGHWYIKAILNGRTITDFTSMAAIAQDELGHARALFRFLEQVLKLPELQLEFTRGANQLHNMDLLDQPPQNWADFVVTVYLAELALWRAGAAQRDGERGPVAKLFSNFGEEGYFHRLYIEGWMEAFSKKENDDALEALARRAPLAARWVSGDCAANAGASEAFAGDVRAQFVDALQLDVVKVEEALEPASRENWDASRRRESGSAMPDGLWEFIVPTNSEAKAARRPLAVSVDDNIDLFDKPNQHRETEPEFG